MDRSVNQFCNLFSWENKATYFVDGHRKQKEQPEKKKRKPDRKKKKE